MNSTLTFDMNQFSKYANARLTYIAEKMPGGKHWDMHMNGQVDTCDAIGLTMRGQVVALYKCGGCSLNELKVFGNENSIEPRGDCEVFLCSSSCAGVFKYLGDWDRSIKEHNADCRPGDTIVAYIAF